MPTYRLRLADGGERFTEAEQFTGYVDEDPPSVHRTAEGRAYVVTALGQRVYPEPGDYILPEANWRGHLVSRPETFTAVWEPVEEGAARPGPVRGSALPNVPNPPDDAETAHGDNHG
jgi:hypothetical protein